MIIDTEKLLKNIREYYESKYRKIIDYTEFSKEEKNKLKVVLTRRELDDINTMNDFEGMALFYTLGGGL